MVTLPDVAHEIRTVIVSVVAPSGTFFFLVETLSPGTNGRMGGHNLFFGDTHPRRGHPPPGTRTKTHTHLSTHTKMHKVHEQQYKSVLTNAQR